MNQSVKRHRGSIYRRILCLVDALAPKRHGMTAQEIADVIEDRTGEKYSPRTIHRDLQYLHDDGYVHRKQTTMPTGSGRLYIWSLNLQRSDAIQNVAFEVLPEVLE